MFLLHRRIGNNSVYVRTKAGNNKSVIDILFVCDSFLFFDARTTDKQLIVDRFTEILQYENYYSKAYTGIRFFCPKNIFNV